MLESVDPETLRRVVHRAMRGEHTEWTREDLAMLSRGRELLTGEMRETARSFRWWSALLVANTAIAVTLGIGSPYRAVEVAAYGLMIVSVKMPFRLGMQLWSLWSERHSVDICLAAARWQLEPRSHSSAG